MVITLEGNVVTITFDIRQDLGPSSTGKTTLVESGSEKIPGTDIRVSLNAFRPRVVEPVQAGSAAQAVSGGPVPVQAQAGSAAQVPLRRVKNA